MGLLVNTLAATGLFEEAEEEAVLRLMVLGHSLDRPRGHLFWNAHAHATGLVIPVTGLAKSFTHNADGRELIYSFVGPSELAGMESCMDGLPHPSALRVVRAGEFFSIARDAFKRFLNEFPCVLPRAIAALSNSFRRDLADRRDAALHSVSERVARFFIAHACMLQNDDAKILVNTTQTELAARTGSVREVIARVVSGFLDQGLITREGQNLYVANWRGLCNAAGIELDAPVDPDCHAGVPSGMRTHRFFLSSTDARRNDTAHKPQLCHEHLDDFAICQTMGCPAAGGDGALPAPAVARPPPKPDLRPFPR